MGDQSGIEWTDATWNPVTGCSKVSPGCAHCYAEATTTRFAGRPGWIAEHRPWTPENASHNVMLHTDRLDQPLRWRRPRMVFVNSMSDLFHEQVPDEFIAAVFGVMAAAPQHTFQVLTKRPRRARAWFEWHARQVKKRDLHHSRWRVCEDEAIELVPDLPAIGAESAWPLSNVWLGVSIENRRFVHRADLLRQVPASVRFISAEPLLGPLVHDDETDGDGHPATGGTCWWDGGDLPELDLTDIDWLIVGGESGARHRPMSMQWARDLRDAAFFTNEFCVHCAGGGREPTRAGFWSDEPCQVRDGARHLGGGTAFFMKQIGGLRQGSDLEELPEDLRVREMPAGQPRPGVCVDCEKNPVRTIVDEDEPWAWTLTEEWAERPLYCPACFDQLGRRGDPVEEDGE